MYAFEILEYGLEICSITQDKDDNYLITNYHGDTATLFKDSYNESYIKISSDNKEPVYYVIGEIPSKKEFGNLFNKTSKFHSDPIFSIDDKKIVNIFDIIDIRDELEKLNFNIVLDQASTIDSFVKITLRKIHKNREFIKKYIVTFHCGNHPFCNSMYITSDELEMKKYILENLKLTMFAVELLKRKYKL